MERQDFDNIERHRIKLKEEIKKINEDIMKREKVSRRHWNVVRWRADVGLDQSEHSRAQMLPACRCTWLSSHQLSAVWSHSTIDQAWQSWYRGISNMKWCFHAHFWQYSGSLMRDSSNVPTTHIWWPILWSSHVSLLNPILHGYAFGRIANPLTSS